MLHLKVIYDKKNVIIQLMKMTSLLVISKTRMHIYSYQSILQEILNPLAWTIFENTCRQNYDWKIKKWGDHSKNENKFSQTDRRLKNTPFLKKSSKWIKNG